MADATKINLCLVARLIGHAMLWGEEGYVFSNREDGKHKGWMENPMPYHSDRNANIELLKYVKSVKRQLGFVTQLRHVLDHHWPDPGRIPGSKDTIFEAMMMEPKIIFDAFCEEFKTELLALAQLQGQ